MLIIDWEVITKDIVSGYFFPLEPRGFFFLMKLSFAALTTLENTAICVI